MASRFLRPTEDTCWPGPKWVEDEGDYPPGHYARHYRELLTKRQAVYLAEVAGAYWHLVAHPCGTEKAIKILRKLRRAHKKDINQG